MVEVSHPAGVRDAAPDGSSVARRRVGWTLVVARRPYLVLVGVGLGFCAALFVAVMLAANGHFEYSLDDAYIHLRLSQMIASGTYGINPGQAASPSSSIAWPFLLAPFSGSPVQSFVPLAISVAALLGTLAVTFRGLSTTWAPFDRSGLGRITTVVVVGLMLNWFGLPFTGMEQSLHVLTAVAAAAGLLQFAYRGSTPWWFWAALVLGPLVRYEGLAVTVATLIAVAALGRRKQALLAGIAMVIPVGLFSVFLLRQGLPALPDSVLAKWGPGETSFSLAGLLQSALVNGAWNLTTRSAVFLLFAICLAATFAVMIQASRAMTRDPRSVPLGAATGVLLLHLAFGRNGWFSRYEVYALSYASVVLLTALSPLAHATFRRIGLRATLLIIAILVLATAPMYAAATLQTPLAAQAIDDRQHQMHVFAVDYLRAGVAVNDLGEVSYQNPYEVVDLVGLGSNQALHARLSGNPHWITEIVDPARIPAAMIYTDWFGDAIPSSWVKVGDIVAQPGYSGGEARVAVYATSAASVPRVAHALAVFATRVGPRTHVVLQSPS